MHHLSLQCGYMVKILRIEKNYGKKMIFYYGVMVDFDKAIRVSTKDTN